jgi:glycosyltransferase involved in cell wall biosynthesis
MTSGGKERRLTELMKSLRLIPDIDFELALMTDDIHYKEVFDLRIKIHYLIRKSRRDLNVFKSYYKLCRDFKPDIVHCWDTMTAIYVTPICKLLKIKLVNGMVVDTQIRQNVMNKFWLRARLTFPFADVVVGNSYVGLASYKAPMKKSVCIYNGIDLKRLDRIKEKSLMYQEIFGNLTQDIFVVGMVAAFEVRKDYDTLIKAALNLSTAFPNIRFVFVGTGVNWNECKERIPDSLADRIVFLGKRNDVESIVNIFDVGVLITNSKAHGEGVSNSIIEYMALGKPVIATSGGGTNEIVFDDLNGYLIEPENVAQLEEKICLLMKDPELRVKLGEEGRKIIHEKFDLKIMTQKYVELYNKLISI